MSEKENSRAEWYEGRDKFSEWESDKYGKDTPLSDRDIDFWIEGFLYAKKKEVK